MYKNNENFKCGNELLKELNAGDYYVNKSFPVRGDDRKYMYDIYKGENEMELKYQFSVKVTSGCRKSVLFNDVKYRDVDTLLEAVRQYHSTLFFPSSLYEPSFNEWARTTNKIHWYLTEKLGMKETSNTYVPEVTYELTNLYGEKLLTLNIAVNESGDRNNSDGTIVRYLSDWRFISMKFDNAEDAVRKINTLFISETTLNISKHLEAFNNIDTSLLSRLEDATINKLDTSLNKTVENYAEKIIPVLEKVLEQLKSNNK